MKFNRDSVVALYLAGRPQVAIVRALQCINVNKSFMRRTIACYRDTGSIARRQGSGRKKIATSAEVVREKELKIVYNN